MDSCLFCKMVDGSIHTNILYEDENLLAFPDIHPVAPVHVLVIPKKHISSLLELEDKDCLLAGQILLGLKKISTQLKLHEKGFRIVNNIGEQGGQTVFHIHFHLIGGRPLSWPPG